MNAGLFFNIGIDQNRRDFLSFFTDTKSRRLKLADEDDSEGKMCFKLEIIMYSYG